MGLRVMTPRRRFRRSAVDLPQIADLWTPGKLTASAVTRTEPPASKLLALIRPLRYPEEGSCGTTRPDAVDDCGPTACGASQPRLANGAWSKTRTEQAGPASVTMAALLEKLNDEQYATVHWAMAPEEQMALCEAMFTSLGILMFIIKASDLALASTRCQQSATPRVACGSSLRISQLRRPGQPGT